MEKPKQTVAERIQQLIEQNPDAVLFDLSTCEWSPYDTETLVFIPNTIVLIEEDFEQFNEYHQDRLLKMISDSGAKAIISIPLISSWPIEFKLLLEKEFEFVRIECIGDDLLGVCGFPKSYKLAFTMPVKNEAEDIERVLKSFRGACDLMVIGVDDTSTDDTYKIALRYADYVFPFTWENDFSKARNACIDVCREYLDTDDWIFMSEGHEHLEAGLDELLALDQVPSGVHVLEVRREDRNSAWMFPWLFRAMPDINFQNPVHNSLEYNYEKHQVAQMPAIRTWHSRSHNNAVERSQQRKGMNREMLLKKLKDDPTDARSCYYLANEWKNAVDVSAFKANERATYYYERYLAIDGKNGPERYQARLSLAKCYGNFLEQIKGEMKVATTDENKKALGAQYSAVSQSIYDMLIVAQEDDWSRTEHWLYLGDLCHKSGKLEQAMRFYETAATGIGREPLSFMWIEKSNYSWVPAQKLVTIYSELGMLKQALEWCDKVKELLPDWAPDEAKAEVEKTREQIVRTMEKK